MSLHQIYFLQRADGLIKIGTSHNFPVRLAHLTKSHGMLGVLRLVHGGAKRERQLHTKFKRFHEYGEWFRDERGALTTLIMALPLGEPLPASSADAEWAAGEAAMMVDVRATIESMLQDRCARTGLKQEAALAAITADYGFRKWFLTHVRNGRASTLSAYAFRKIKEAHLSEMQTSLDFYRGEIAKMKADDDDAELLSFAQEIDAIEAELNRRRKA